MNAQPVRNLRGFIKSYMGSESGRAALARKPYTFRDRDGNRVSVYQNNVMAVALKAAAERK